MGYWRHTPQHYSQKHSAGSFRHLILSETMPLNPFDYVGKAVQKRFRNYGVYRGRVLELVSVRGTLYFRVSGESFAEREGREAYVYTGGIVSTAGARDGLFTVEKRREKTVSS